MPRFAPSVTAPDHAVGARWVAPLLAALSMLTLTACGASRAPLKAQMAPLAVSAPAAPKALTENHFQRDRIGTLSEAHVREILAAPVFLEAGARVGIVPVVDRYEPDGGVPLTEVTGALATELADAGFFEVVTEISTDWPSTRSIAGLRELAARYRAEYLLLYRHRFVDRRYVNAWGWSWLTLVGGLITPSETLEAAGVLEATLFDVKSGTLLFSAFERVSAEQKATIWYTDRAVRKMQARLLDGAAERLSAAVLEQLRALVAARPSRSQEEALAQAVRDRATSVDPGPPPTAIATP